MVLPGLAMGFALVGMRGILHYWYSLPFQRRVFLVERVLVWQSLPPFQWLVVVWRVSTRSKRPPWERSGAAVSGPGIEGEGALGEGRFRARNFAGLKEGPAGGDRPGGGGKRGEGDGKKGVGGTSGFDGGGGGGGGGGDLRFEHLFARDEEAR